MKSLSDFKVWEKVFSLKHRLAE